MLTKENILEIIKEEAEQCFDKEQVIGDICYRVAMKDEKDKKNGLILVESNGFRYNTELKAFSPHAEGQLLAKLSIPASYYHRCPVGVQSFNYNYWAQEEPFKSKKIVLRCRKYE